MDEIPAALPGSRRNEDIALDLMKFIAATTGVGKATSTTAGFSGGGSPRPEDYASALLELYTRCLRTIENK